MRIYMEYVERLRELKSVNTSNKRIKEVKEGHCDITPRKVDYYSSLKEGQAVNWQTKTLRVFAAN